ncbi:hypothetical protein [Paucibacter soli]|uniref:hypothetical protein n=1 Tax=Paucibacter soli TaxID=3133433 RepID=UPI00309BAA5D
MSYLWIASAASAAAVLGIAASQSMSKPMPSHVKPMASGFQSERILDKNLIDKALIFAVTAKGAGNFAGTAAFPALAASASSPSGLLAGGYSSQWTAKYSGSVLTVCYLGASNAVVDAVSTKVSGVTAKNSGC